MNDLLEPGEANVRRRSHVIRAPNSWPRQRLGDLT